MAFYRAEDELGFIERPQGRLLLSELTLVDRHGRAVFGVHDLRTVTYAQLLQSSAAGVLDGDPLRPYLIVEAGYGDVPPPDWPTFAAAFEVASDVVRTMAEVGGAIALGKLVLDSVRERVDRGREALQEHWTDWTQRSQRPDQFATLLQTGVWTAQELAAVLDCEPSEAQAIAWALGFVYEEAEQRWVPGADEASRVLLHLREDAWLVTQQLHEDWEPMFRARVVEYVETGEPPSNDAVERHLEERMRREATWESEPGLRALLRRWRDR